MASKVYRGWLLLFSEPVRRAAQCHESPRVGHVGHVSSARRTANQALPTQFFFLENLKHTHIAHVGLCQPKIQNTCVHKRRIHRNSFKPQNQKINQCIRNVS